jgi:hypothetical protein
MLPPPIAVAVHSRVTGSSVGDQSVFAKGRVGAVSGYEVAEFRWELRRHLTSALCERTPQTAFGMGASRNDVIIGTSRSARFTTVTWEVPGRMAS